MCYQNKKVQPAEDVKQQVATPVPVVPAPRSERKLKLSGKVRLIQIPRELEPAVLDEHELV